MIWSILVILIDHFYHCYYYYILCDDKHTYDTYMRDDINL